MTIVITDDATLVLNLSEHRTGAPMSSAHTMIS
jgi:hypothetical protein